VKFGEWAGLAPLVLGGLTVVKVKGGLGLTGL
ncbi:hypothetical protein Tco_1462011, partial [Tanacetum coccineum]